jgi:hypothetical protein
MMQRRLAYLPLHGGKAPAYLFKRMTALAGAMTMAIVEEYGSEEMLRRLADPWWFQAFGCVLGFDWHSSGVTTVTCGALKEAHKRFGKDMGIIAAGGKGKTSRKTPQEIISAAERYGISAGDKLVYASRMSAKVDSAAVQDGYQLYHHSFFFTLSGSWCVVQQGMNERNARRYHWLGEKLDTFVREPHAAVHDLRDSNSIALQKPRAERELFPNLQDAGTEELPLLNMVAIEAEANRQASSQLVRENPKLILETLATHAEGPTLFAPTHHPLLPKDVNLSRLEKIVKFAHEKHPKDFETLLGTANVGPATIRSLALIAELIYGAPISQRDPVAPKESQQQERKWPDYAYAHGGKDGFPFPVDRTTYDKSIGVLTDAVRKARVGESDKKEALKRLAKISAD